jgi:hypothetical protein
MGWANSYYRCTHQNVSVVKIPTDSVSLVAGHRQLLRAGSLGPIIDDGVSQTQDRQYRR